MKKQVKAKRPVKKRQKPAEREVRVKSKRLVEGEFSLPKAEEQALKFWEAEKVFEKSLALRQKGRRFVFFEGPPYANGKPGIHHVLARIMKDIMLRYKTMQGFEVPRKGGWDTHGLPVEIAAEKALGLKTKADIERFGIQKFNEEAKKAVWLYKDEWETLTRRIGYWLDLKNAYITYTSDYVESLWWIFAQMAKKKLLYKGHKVVPWCARCGTALSSHELAQGYKEVEDESVYMKFRLRPGQKIGKNFKTDDKTYILSWTTTPWTLPGNVALAVGEKISYAALRVDGTPELFILASELVGSVFKDKRVEISHDHIRGEELVGLEYEPLFKVPALKKPAAYKVYAADFVTTTDGTGVVHTAVMYGEDDYKLGVKVGLPQHHTVTEEGTFTKEVPDVAGLLVKAKETEQKIFTHLEKHKFLLRTEKYKHEYPHCWRCGTPVLYFARDSWFIGMSKLRSQLLNGNKNIHWVPKHVKEGRFGEWLREVKDWNLSRERYWGTPLPIWECAKCKTHEVVGSLDELDRRQGGSRNEYYIMRHGEAESNVLHMLDSGQREFHLTTMGREQANAAAKLLKNKKIDIIISSDITRAKETAQIAAKALGVKKIKYDKRLREINLGKELTGQFERDYSLKYPTYEDRFEKRPEGGESLRDVRARAYSLLQELEKEHSGKRILIVAHEYPIWMYFHMALGWTERQAVAEKVARDGDNSHHPEPFVTFAAPSVLAYKLIPRDSTGLADPHRPFVDTVTFKCRKCKAPMRRIPEVADVWFDSGAMPFAQQHYPFENKATIDEGLMYPADYISEGMDQTRGWFYTLLAVATTLGYEAPYKNVVCLGLINDKYGQKMSKSKGNIIEPFSVIDKYGVDAVRWYFYTATPPGDTKNFDEVEVGKALRRYHLILWNSLVFWKTYADRNAKPVAGKIHVLDAWIMARLNETVQQVTDALERYEIREAALALEVLTDDLSRWFIRRSRRRLQKPESQKDLASASATLGTVLMTVAKLTAPFTPFFGEALYQELRRETDPASVHLADWPNPDKKLVDKKLIAGMAEVRTLASAALAKRAELGIKVRQPLQKLEARDEKLAKVSKELLEILKDEANVKEVRFNKKLAADIELDTIITSELKAEGILRELMRAIQGLRAEARLTPGHRIHLGIEAAGVIGATAAAHPDFFKKEVGAKDVVFKKLEKFDAELQFDVDGVPVWLGLRKA
ncbi:MAG TPA: class I tRNA ligase family protein [Candidatus Paceibacterota bacterium]|nr:class I tRNA ligase family protein [Candidatus Paceibacterota bacterium]